MVNRVIKLEDIRFSVCACLCVRVHVFKFFHSVLALLASCFSNTTLSVFFFSFLQREKINLLEYVTQSVCYL